MIHTTIGLYADGTYKVNGVPSGKLAKHILYNLEYRPGRSFIVDGVLLNPASILFKSQLNLINDHLIKIKSIEDTSPYV